MTFILYLIVSLFLLVCLILTMLVLIQKGRGGGLASAFGGGAGGHTAFGSKTGDVLTWATSIVFGIFLLLAVAANLTFNAIKPATAGPAITITKPTTAPGSTTPGATVPVTAIPGATVPDAQNSTLPPAPINPDSGSGSTAATPGPTTR